MILFNGQLSVLIISAAVMVSAISSADLEGSSTKHLLFHHKAEADSYDSAYADYQKPVHVKTKAVHYHPIPKVKKVKVLNVKAAHHQAPKAYKGSDYY